MRSNRAIEEEEGVQFPWLGAFLFISSVTLAIQLFPSILWWVFDVVDVRRWTWRSYAVVSAGAIVGLVGLKAWLEREK